jgi:hypothetical protein
MFRTGGLQKRAVGFDGARRLVDLIVQLSKIVLRGDMCWAIVSAFTGVSLAISTGPAVG